MVYAITFALFALAVFACLHLGRMIAPSDTVIVAFCIGNILLFSLLCSVFNDPMLMMIPWAINLFVTAGWERGRQIVERQAQLKLLDI